MKTLLSHIADAGSHLSYDDLRSFIAQAFQQVSVTGKRVLFVIPDYTRSMPMPDLFRAFHEELDGRVAKMDYLIALGTHPPMSDEAINTMLGLTPADRAGRYARVDIYNHDWRDPDTLKTIGIIPPDEIAALSGGLMRQEAVVQINKRIFDYDAVFIVGPVFPHEVVGFSGGNKYFFPGIAGAEILNLFHWLGALITNPVINGTKYTPVRDVINRAADFIDMPRYAFCLNVFDKTKCRGIFFDTPENAWDAAADLSAQTHVVYKDKPYKSVMAVAPAMYDEIWVAGKCMYKLEPVVADGGELIIYAPHIDEISITHGKIIKELGYHTRDYYLADWDRFKDYPLGILAHSTHVRGIGTCINGQESCRVNVTLATAIPEEVCRAINLGYRDPAGLNPDDWKNREDEGLLYVPNAGEVLYRLKENNPVPGKPNLVP